MSRKAKLFTLLLIVSMSTVFMFGCKTAPSEEAAQEEATQEEFPSKPITIVVPLSAGGAADRNARLAAGALERYAGVPVKVINLPGAGGIEGISYFFEAQPNGYTLLSGNGTSVMSRMILQEAPYKGTDLTAVVNYTYLTSGLIVKSDAPWNTLQEFLDYVKENPGQVSVALGGAGSTSDLNATALFGKLGLEIIPVQYSGSGPAVVAVAGGHVEAAVAADGSIVPVLQEGSIKVLAGFGPERTPGFPDAPTLLEQGIDYSSSSAHAFWARPDVPQERLDILEALFMQALADEHFLFTADLIELEVVPEGSKTATEKLHAEWAELVEFFK